MKCVMIFLGLTLVVLMVQPGECRFGGLKAMVQGAEQAYKEYKYQKDMEKMAKRYGADWKQQMQQMLQQQEQQPEQQPQPGGDGQAILIFDL